MKLSIITVGKKDQEEYREIIKLFSERAKYYFEIDWIIIKPVTNSGKPDLIKIDEGKNILQKIKPSDFVVLLDEKGNNISSDVFAELIQKHLNRSTEKIVFVIGGAYGVSEDVLKRANFTWSLSKLVFPHQIVRVLLIEQIYRAGNILNGGKYHHE